MAEILWQEIDLIGYASGWGAQLHQTENGPGALMAYNLAKKLTKQGQCPPPFCILHPRHSCLNHRLDPKDTLDVIVDHLENLSKKVENTINVQRFPIVLGGDHTMAVGTFSGAIHALDAYQDFGLLWIDAHMDAHTPETTPSGAYHGMPVAALLGYGTKALTHLHDAVKKIRPDHLILMGVRSYEREEEDFLKSLGVRVYKSNEIQDRGFQTCVLEALSTFSKKVSHLGVSLDLDVFDPFYAPGVGSPAPDGLSPSNLFYALNLLKTKEFFRVLEISEYNPCQDYNFRTANLVIDLLRVFLEKSETPL